MTDGLGIALREVVEEAADELEGVERMLGDDAMELRRDGRTFVVLAGAVGEFLLGQDVAVAAMRTPGVSASERGPEWIRFRPEELDRFSLDRAVAWTGLSWRRAAS